MREVDGGREGGGKEEGEWGMGAVRTGPQERGSWSVVWHGTAS